MLLGKGGCLFSIPGIIAVEVTKDPPNDLGIGMTKPSPTSVIRILFICHDGEIYGSQQSLLLLATHLPKAGFSVSVSIARPGPLTDRLGELPEVSVFSHRRLQWIKHDPRPAWRRLGDIAALVAGMPGKVSRLCRFIREQQIQVVHTNSVVSLEGAIAARLCGVPHVWHIRELFMEENPKLNPLLGRSWTRRIIDRLSDRVLCISQAVYRQFGPFLSQKEKYRVLYNAMAAEASSHDEEEKALPPKNGHFRIGYIGRLSEGKRFHDLVEALHHLRLENNLLSAPLELVVAGNFVDTPFQERVHGMIREYGLEDSVHLLGYRQDLGPLYETLDVMVVPSLNEPFGRVVIEGMRAGVPCIAANSGGIPEIIEDGETGLLYPPKDVNALRDALRQAMADPDRLAGIREKAGRMVRERFTIEEQIRALTQVYRELVPVVPEERN